MEAPEFNNPKIATVEINDLEKKLVDLNVLIEAKLEKINEIERILDEQEFLQEDSKEWMSDDKIVELVEERDKLVESKMPLEAAYDKALAEKEGVLKRKTLLN